MDKSHNKIDKIENAITEHEEYIQKKDPENRTSAHSIKSDDIEWGMNGSNPVPTNNARISARATRIEGISQETEVPDFKKIILNAITQPQKRQDGVKITDITTCTRQKVFEFDQPKVRSSQNIVRMATGTALHHYTQKRINNPDPETYDVELPVEYNGYVFGNIDLYHKKLMIVIDIKTKIVNSNNGTFEIRPYSSQEEQLRDLMAMKGAPNGVLALILIGGNEPVKIFKYHMNKDEIQDQLKRLEEKASSFLNAKN